MPSTTIAPSARSYLLKETALFLAFSYLLFFANTWRAYSDYNQIRIGVAAMVVASVGWLILGLRPGTLKPTPLAAPLLIFLAAYLLAALTSINSRRSLDEAWVTAMYVFGFALVAQLSARGWPRELFVKTLLLAGALVMGLAWFVFLNWYRGWLAVAPEVWIPDIAYRLPLANGVATLLNLLMLSAIARFMSTRARAPRIFLALWIISALSLLYLTASRGGWLGAAAGIGTLAVVRARDAGGVAFVRGLWLRARQQWQLSIVIAVIGLAGLVGAGALATRQVVNPTKATASQARVEYWGPAWQAFLQSPITGQGPLTFGSAYLRINSVPPYGFFAHAHSIFFNLLAETGLVGVTAFGVLAVAASASLWRQVNRLTGDDRAVAVGALAGAVYWAAHSVVDSVNVEPMNSMLMAVILGAALASRDADAHVGNRSGRWPSLSARWPVVLGLALSATGLYNVWRLAPLHQGVLSATKSHWTEAASHFDDAARRDPGSAIAHQQAGLAYSILADKGDAGALDRAIAEFETTVQIDPDWWLNHANLASLYLARSDTESALREMRAAVELGYDSPLTQLNWGVVAEAAGETAEARKAFTKSLDLRRDWADAYFWRATPFRAQVLRDWRVNTAARPVLTLTQMEALSRGGDRSSDYAPVIGAYLEMGRVDDADLLLRKAKLSYYTTGEDRIEIDWLEAELAAAFGDWQTAVRLGEQAVGEYQAQSVFGPGAFGAAAYGQIFFRQETTAVDLAPQLTPAPFTDKWATRMLTLGDWYAAMGDRAGAEAVYQRLLTLVPDNAGAAERLAK